MGQPHKTKNYPVQNVINGGKIEKPPIDERDK